MVRLASVFLSLSALGAATLFGTVSAQGGAVYNVAIANLTGTWSTGSGAVLTGVGFYNPVNRAFNIPMTAGESYSFTSDGFWEQALVKWISNPTEPECPSLHLIWQHGTYNLYTDNNTLHLTPYWGDGHQYMSSYCKSEYSPTLPNIGPSTLGSWMGVQNKQDGSLGAYNQEEEFRVPVFNVDTHYGQTFEVMQLQQPSGKRKNRLYKYLNPPQMLPTERLHVEVYGQP